MPAEAAAEPERNAESAQDTCTLTIYDASGKLNAAGMPPSPSLLRYQFIITHVGHDTDRSDSIPCINF